MHGGVNETCVVVVALHVPGAVKPIYPHGLDAGFGITTYVLELHDSAQIVRLPGRLANEIDLVWTSN